MIGFTEEDFNLFAQADGDSCKACLTGEKNGVKVTQEEFSDYLDKFVERGVDTRFERLWDLINGALTNHITQEIDMALTFRNQPKSQIPKLRPIYYGIISNEGIGQNRAQLNLRLSDDKRPNDKVRKRKFGIKFSLHHRCKEGLPNKDMGRFERNINDKPKTFINFLKRLNDGFVVFKNYGSGIEEDYMVANQLEIGEINDLFLAKEGDEINFQEIHKSYYYDDPHDREIIRDLNRLAAECHKTILSLYPLYLYATVDDPAHLRKQLNIFSKIPKNLKKLMECTRIIKLERNSISITEGQEIHPRDIFGYYVADAKRLLIGDNWIPFNRQLPRTVVEICRLVKNKTSCQIIIKTRPWEAYHYRQKAEMSESEFHKALDALKREVISLGFDMNRFTVLWEDMRDRELETDRWKIVASHGLDFYKPSWKARKSNLLFIPEQEYVCT